jgi:hypothetical protein
MTKQVVLALTADSQDIAFDEMRAFAKEVERLGLGRLRHEGSQESGRTEVFSWSLDGGALSASIHDDPDLPAMYLWLQGDDSLMDAAADAAVRSFVLAPIADVVAAAENEHEDDPTLLVMAALIADKQHRDRVLALLKTALASKERPLRVAAAKAAGVLATASAKKLVKGALAREQDGTLKQQMETLLERWGQQRPD